MRHLITCLITGLAAITGIAAETLGNNPPWASSVIAFEHHDSGRTKLFPQANFNGTFQRENVIDVRTSSDNYLTPYNIVFQNAHSMFLYGGGYGDEGGTGAFVARVDPSTLGTVWSTQLANTVEANEWDYPGVLSAVKDGYL